MNLEKISYDGKRFYVPFIYGDPLPYSNGRGYFSVPYQEIC